MSWYSSSAMYPRCASSLSAKCSSALRCSCCRSSMRLSKSCVGGSAVLVAGTCTAAQTSGPGQTSLRGRQEAISHRYDCLVTLHCTRMNMRIYVRLPVSARAGHSWATAGRPTPTALLHKCFSYVCAKSVSGRQTCIENGFQFMPGSVGCAGPMPLLISSSSTQRGVSLPLIQRGTSSSMPFILKSGARGFRLPVRLSQNWLGFSSRYLHLSSMGELEVCMPGDVDEALSVTFQQLAQELRMVHQAHRLHCWP